MRRGRCRSGSGCQHKIQGGPRIACGFMAPSGLVLLRHPDNGAAAVVDLRRFASARSRICGSILGWSHEHRPTFRKESVKYPRKLPFVFRMK